MAAPIATCRPHHRRSPGSASRPDTAAAKRAIGPAGWRRASARQPAHPALSPEISATEDRRNQVRAGAKGVGRRAQRSRQVFGGHGKRGKRRRREGRHRPDAANHGGCAVSLDSDAIAEGSSRRRARRSLAADMAISGLTPSDRPSDRPPADRNESGRFGEDGSDTDGPAAQLGAILLLDGREERVEVDGEVAEHGATIGGRCGASMRAAAIGRAVT